MQTKTTIDMVRIGFKMDAEEFEKFMQNYNDKHFVLRQENDQYIQRYGYFEYRHLWVFGTDESSVSIGYGLNSIHEKKNKGFIEWNPNKVNIKVQGALSSFIRTLLLRSSFQLTRCDIANDLKHIEMRNCFADRMKKRGFHTYTGDDTTTWYFGERGRTGQVKIYDKAKEVKDKSKQVIGSLTRYETTYKADIFHVPEKHSYAIYGELEPIAYPQVIIVEQEELESLPFIDTVVIKELINSPWSMEYLTKYQKEKYKGANCCKVYTPDYVTDNICAHKWYKTFVEWIYPTTPIYDDIIP